MNSKRNLEHLMQIQLLAEAVLQRAKVKLPDGYIEMSHSVMDKFSVNRDYFQSDDIKSISLLSCHPVRNMLMGLTPIPTLLGSCNMQDAAAITARVITDMANPNIPLDKTIAYLISNVDSVKQIVEGSHAFLADGAGVATRNTGILMNILGPHRYVLLGKPMFLVDQLLCEGLLQTSFGMDTPSFYLRAPMPYCYIEFGTQRDLGVFVHNDESGLHEVEGVYISEVPYDGRMRSGLLDFMVSKKAASLDSGSLRYIELEFTGSPLGKASVMDDATFNISLFVDDEAGLTISEICALHVAFYSDNRHTGALFTSTPMDNACAVSFEGALELLIKCLIFINSDLSTRQTILERRALEKQLNGLKNPAKRRKLQRKVNAAKDYILITSKAPLEYKVAGAPNGGAKSAHWRRGHFRNQRFGEGNAQVKIKWIQPVLVGVGAAAIKTYKVKE